MRVSAIASWSLVFFASTSEAKSPFLTFLALAVVALMAVVLAFLPLTFLSLALVLIELFPWNYFRMKPR
jgi:hypothetical protein